MNTNKIALTLTGTVNLNQYGWPEVAGIDLRDIVTAASKTGRTLTVELKLYTDDSPAREEVRS